MKVSAFIKGLGAGVIVGSMVYMCCAKKPFGKRSGIGRALRKVGAVVEDVTDLIGL
ncbi:MAG: hypothetical protein IKK00_03045 [Oscillospiraceae bacterium]|nr:hypothetical protein [Oscillospiraceae bacterium]